MTRYRTLKSQPAHFDLTKAIMGLNREAAILTLPEDPDADQIRARYLLQRAIAFAKMADGALKAHDVRSQEAPKLRREARQLPVSTRESALSA